MPGFVSTLTALSLAIASDSETIVPDIFKKRVSIAAAPFVADPRVNVACDIN
jgi:hypothetical protein